MKWQFICYSYVSCTITPSSDYSFIMIMGRGLDFEEGMLWNVKSMKHSSLVKFHKNGFHTLPSEKYLVNKRSIFIYLCKIFNTNIAFNTLWAILDSLCFNSMWHAFNKFNISFRWKFSPFFL